MAEHWSPKPAVGGSIPSCPERKMKDINEYREEVGRFAKDVEQELKKITWPTRNETIKSTIAVLTISGIFALFLSLADYLFSILIGSILS